jgi:transposase
MGELTLSKKEQARSQVLNRLLGGELSVWEVAMVLGLSERQVWRILAAYRKEGAAVLAHGNWGRKPANAIPEEVKDKVGELARGLYYGVNHSHLTELLKEREGIALSRSTARRILIAAGIKSPRKRRPPKHRSRRERYPEEGMLLQIDGSRHDWLEGRGPYLTLIGAIDDATGKVPYALFREEEDAQGYILLLRHIVAEYGIPLALYHDGHGIFERCGKEPETIEEQLEGRRRPTQFGRVMEELGIVSITSPSPQAKGRVERLWGTFQDRLVSELRIAGASDATEANKVLGDFLPRHNQRFAVLAAGPGLAYQEPSQGFTPDEVFCFKYERTVGRDNVVRFGEHRLQIMPTNGRLSYVQAKVEVQERMDGSLAVYYKGQCLATKPAPPQAPVLRAKNIKRAMPGGTESSEAKIAILARKPSPPKAPGKHGPDHPWRRPFQMYVNR